MSRGAHVLDGADGSIAWLCRDLDRCIEIDLARVPSRRDGAMTRSWHGEPVFAKPPYVKLDGSFDPAERGVDGLARRDAPGQIRNRCSPIAAGITIDSYEILQRLHDFATFKPACRFTDANVPLGMSSPKLPLTVTRPGLIKCLNCRWLPSVLTSPQPSA